MDVAKGQDLNSVISPSGRFCTLAPFLMFSFLLLKPASPSSTQPSDPSGGTLCVLSQIMSQTWNKHSQNHPWASYQNSLILMEILSPNLQNVITSQQPRILSIQGEAKLHLAAPSELGFEAVFFFSWATTRLICLGIFQYFGEYFNQKRYLCFLCISAQSWQFGGFYNPNIT